MRILLTTTSFTDTPGKHQTKLKELDFEVDYLRGPLKEEELINIISKYDGIICGDDEITRNVLINGSNGKLKIISFYAKKARGLMVRYIVDNNVKDYDNLLGFNLGSYSFNESETVDINSPVFTR